MRGFGGITKSVTMKENKGQIQTVDNGTNVLVDTVNSDNRHSYFKNKKVEINKVLSDNEVIELWKARTDKNELELAMNWIKKQDSYAVSNCVDKTLGIKYSSIVNYNEL